MTRSAAAPYLTARRPPRRRAPSKGGYYLALRRRAQEPAPATLLRLVHPAPRAAAAPKPPAAPEEVRARFEALVRRWKAETRFESSSTKLFLHPAYQQIIGMGAAVVPLLLESLARAPEHWSWALKAITGADPVPAGARGNVKQMADAWLEWARRAGLA